MYDGRDRGTCHSSPGRRNQLQDRWMIPAVKDSWMLVVMASFSDPLKWYRWPPKMCGPGQEVKVIGPVMWQGE